MSHASNHAKLTGAIIMAVVALLGINLCAAYLWGIACFARSRQPKRKRGESTALEMMEDDDDGIEKVGNVRTEGSPGQSTDGADTTRSFGRTADQTNRNGRHRTNHAEQDAVDQPTAVPGPGVSSEMTDEPNTALPASEDSASRHGVDPNARFGKLAAHVDEESRDVKQRSQMRLLLAEERLRSAMGSVAKAASKAASGCGASPYSRVAATGDEDEEDTGSNVGRGTTYGLD